MNTNDLPPAARLAALIEAGRAANPNIPHGYGYFIAAEGTACALGYACLAAGASIAELKTDGPLAVRKYLGLDPSYNASVAWSVMCANDLERQSIDEIILSLREGKLAKCAELAK